MFKRILTISLAILMAACAGCVRTEAPSNEPDNAEAIGFINKKGQAVPLSIRIKDREKMPLDSYDAAYSTVNNEFAVTMLGAMPEDHTCVFSPLSLQIALQILAAGGDEATCEKMLNSICPGLDRKTIETSSAALIDRLVKSEGVTINSAVAVNSAYQVCEAFANSAADNYLASVGTLDFSDPDAALAEINGWVEHNTDGLIKQLLDRDDISVETAVVILNALTLKLNWKHPFTLQRGQIVFTDINGNTSSAPEMKLVKELNYGKFPEGQMAVLPYEGGEYAMALILPAEGVSASEAAAALIGKYESCSPINICIRMPKLELNDKIDVLKMAEKLGIKEALEGNYSEIIGDSVSITTVLQGATLSVTESGTTAAAATAIVGTKGVEWFETEMVCDRPFAMVIYNVETGAVLFVSVVNSLD